MVSRSRSRMVSRSTSGSTCWGICGLFVNTGAYISSRNGTTFFTLGQLLLLTSCHYSRGRGWSNSRTRGRGTCGRHGWSTCGRFSRRTSGHRSGGLSRSFAWRGCGGRHSRSARDLGGVSSWRKCRVASWSLRGVVSGRFSRSTCGLLRWGMCWYLGGRGRRGRHSWSARSLSGVSRWCHRGCPGWGHSRSPSRGHCRRTSGCSSRGNSGRLCGRSRRGRHSRSSRDLGGVSSGRHCGGTSRGFGRMISGCTARDVGRHLSRGMSWHLGGRGRRGRHSRSARSLSGVSSGRHRRLRSRSISWHWCRSMCWHISRGTSGCLGGRCRRGRHSRSTRDLSGVRSRRHGRSFCGRCGRVVSRCFSRGLSRMVSRH